ncbi:Oidioi.mRNA.OKI2018_I69.chr1.g1611.t1.cds [Oikopleura dioica]|uniref:Oidioi.mRNA.OKI2018_I69.chr1.g1611.t1.cds n=1 Tax=Oikopleura dioica TaxID=34765 RepID=A0ABN7STI4_OIKDI|nr:Oidioi.mRNA.OKI2018_I69.chr1.g1611.t1.cds [Oikopleura dioica]
MAATDNKVSVVLLGLGGVGKSCICLKLTQPSQEIPHEHIITPWTDTFQHRVYLRRGKSVLLEIDDTAGQEEMRALSEVKLDNKDAVILVLSLSDEESLDTAARWFEKAREKYLRTQREAAQQGKTPKKSKGVERPLPIVVACNKCDLSGNEIRVTRETISERIQIPENQIIYTSAKTNQNVELLFKTAAELVLNTGARDSHNCMIM